MEWTHERYLDTIEAEMALMAAAATRSDPAARIPSCPEWSVAELVVHTGHFLRWVTHVLATRTRERVALPAELLELPGDPRDYAGWFAASAAGVLPVLRRADPDTPVWTWGARPRAEFWLRRVLHEITVHRNDLETVEGSRQFLSCRPERLRPARLALSKDLDFYAESNKRLRKAYAESGYPETSKIVISLPVFVAETDAEAFRVGDALFDKHLDIWVAAESWSGHRSADYPTHTDMGSMLRSRTATQRRESGSGLFGSPERVADQIRVLQEASAVDGLIGQVDFDGVSGVVAERSLRLFIDKVIPAIGDL
ncbi:LLM class flavin-dependent oxidoreductase [Nocardia sp. alder85J]|uniref:LLM class flavin-dependent oxidoreductase n=1 Tax=Nocardia sp. alder85J TaxID=2862949 RepID=UPI001CD43175|nr:LLM class flavin-dependent oxidoreductase [Nocardia sp. alder85J]MCX4097595.1 LLM class flavin-dependent oxidoreductase [Nocardia sp. alder85J]